MYPSHERCSGGIVIGQYRMVEEWLSHPSSLAEAEEVMIAKLEARTRKILADMRRQQEATQAVFGEDVLLLDGSRFLTGLIARRTRSGIRLIFTLLRNDESAIYANPPGEYQGGYHYIVGKYAKLFGGDICNTNWEVGSFTIIVDA